MSRTFTRVDDTALRKVISEARKRLVFIAPGIDQHFDALHGMTPKEIENLKEATN